jgi:hypothetical protein
MFKRTKGYFLLTMLVLTGLAGRIHSDTLSNKERNKIINQLIATNAVLAEHISSLYPKQLNYKPAHKLSVKEKIYHLVVIENNLWSLAKAGLQKHAAMGSYQNRNDQVLITSIAKPQEYTEQLFQLQKVKFKSINQAMKLFKENRKEISTYIKTTTDDVRSHIVQTPLGNLDIYQLMLVSLTCTDYYINQIEAVLSDTNFPKS